MAAWDGHMHVDLEPPYLITKPGLTEEDFYRLADEDSDWEYLDGRIVMHSPASDRHEEWQMRNRSSHFRFLIPGLRFPVFRSPRRYEAARYC
jgi:hypothetical protein